MAEVESNIQIISRNKITVSGADGIVSFSKTEAVLSTCLGYLAVSGDNFVVDCFDKENNTVSITGNINAVFYPGGKKEDKSFIKKLFFR